MAQPDPSLVPYRKVQAANEREMRRILEATAKSIQARILTLRPGIGGEVRAAQLRLVLAAIARMQRTMWRGAIDPRVKRAMDDAEKAAESAIETMSRVAYAALPERVADTLIDGLRLAAESGLKSDRARKRRALSAMVYHQEALHRGRVEQTIREGLIAGLSAKELADDVYKYVSPNTPGGASYAAMRLARTEINNAFHERQLQGAKRPGVQAAKWNLSGSHTTPDKCNVYAEHGGNGHWAPDNIPDKPHPQCFCYLTYIMMSAEQFREKLESGGFDDEIDRRTRENMARLGQKVEPAKAPKPKSSPILDAYRGGVVSREKLTGGNVAKTDIVTTKSGKKLVHKVSAKKGKPPYNDPIRQNDAEELSSKLLRAIGLNAPIVERLKPKEIVMDLKDGDVAATLNLSEQHKLGSTRDGLLIGLFDLVTDNNDRHDGNWLVDGDRLIPIDHSHAWGYTQQDPDQPKLFVSDFDSALGLTAQEVKTDGGFKLVHKWKDTKVISARDVQAFREKLIELRPEFERLGHIDWYDNSLRRLDAIEPHAKGRGRLIS